jgi:hypothetical protein
MGYGEAVLFKRPEEIGKDKKVSPGELDWVICRSKSKLKRVSTV